MTTEAAGDARIEGVLLEMIDDCPHNRGMEDRKQDCRGCLRAILSRLVQAVREECARAICDLCHEGDFRIARHPLLGRLVHVVYEDFQTKDDSWHFCDAEALHALASKTAGEE